MRIWLVPAAIAAVAAPIYLWQLGAKPTFGGDEARFAVHAHELAMTGRDLDGTPFPLLFRIYEYSFWYQAGLFYLIAAVLKAAPLSEWSARLPMVIAGLADIVLIFFVARKMLGSTRYGAIAAILMALTPAHLIFSRQALDYLLPMPFVLGWFLCLLIVLERSSTAAALVGGALLGLAVYTHFSAWTMAPLYLVLSIVALLVSSRTKAIVPFVAGCALMLLPLMVWLVRHPAYVAETAQHYGLYDSTRFSALQGSREIVNWMGIEVRLSVFWDYFNPGYLFMSGGSSMTAATRKAGVFLLPFALFIPCGIVALWQQRRAPASWIVLVGFVTAPIAVSVLATRYLIQRELYVLPFGVLLGTAGVAWLMTRSRLAVRVVTVALLVLAPVQFAFFYRDYLGDYVTRSAIWFDPGSFAQSSAHVLERDTAAIPEIWISDALDDALVHWPYQMRKRGRADLLGRSHYFAADRYDVASIPAGSVLLIQHNDPNLPRLVGEGRCCTIDTYLNGVDGNRSVAVLIKR